MLRGENQGGRSQMHDIVIRGAMTLGSAAATHLRLIVWCRDCRHQVEPDPAEMAKRYGAETTVHYWRERLRCSQSGSRNKNSNSVSLHARILCLPPLTDAWWTTVVRSVPGVCRCRNH
jgi:hypothetical protein